MASKVKIFCLMVPPSVTCEKKTIYETPVVTFANAQEVRTGFLIVYKIFICNIFLFDIFIFNILIKRQ